MVEKDNKVRVSWIKNGSDYQRVEGECDNVETIPPGIYTVHLNDKRGWWLEFYRDNFTFDYKIYGVENGFIDYFLDTYKNTTGNIGVMFNGIKGTGKTVTAKVLANKLNIPVIIVKGMGDINPALMEYLSSFNFDCIYFFDEFEKNFEDKDASVLQIMDGVYNSEYRKVFLLTTNRTWVNENLLSRPSRIRYVKEFKNISKELVDEYIEENLNDKSGKDIIVSYIDSLEVSTIDILKTVVQEVNIHGADNFKKNMKTLNASKKDIRYICHRLVVNSNDRISINDFLDICKCREEITGIRYVANDNTLSSANGIRDAEDFSSIIPSGYTYSKTMNNEIIEHYARQMNANWIIRSSVSFKKLTIGDIWYDEEIIAYVDYEKKVVVAEYGGMLSYYYVTNSEEKNSNYFSENYSKYSFLY